MTAFSFDLGRDHLSIASDTVIYTTGSPARIVGHGSKVFTIPHLRFALCGRGVVEIIVDIYRRLVVAAPGTFAEAIDMLPELARAATEAWAAESGLDDHGDRQVVELLAGGYDREGSRARLVLCVNYRGFQPEEYPAGAGYGVIPSLPRDLRPNLDAFPARERLMACMRAAAAYFAAEARGVVVGGAIELTVVSATKVSTREIGFLPVPALAPISVQGIAATPGAR